MTRTLKETVDAIIRYMENDCQMEPEYRRRADVMFGFSDYESSKRIFEGAEHCQSGGAPMAALGDLSVPHGLDYGARRS